MEEYGIWDAIKVSILSQLRCWEQQETNAKILHAIKVSILSQLRCWEQHLHRGWFSFGRGVSILSQLRCWEQPVIRLVRQKPKKFHYSPRVILLFLLLFFCHCVSFLSMLRCCLIRLIYLFLYHQRSFNPLPA